MTPSVLVATPTTRYTVYNGYCATIAQLFSLFGATGIRCMLRTVDGYSVESSRDMLADEFLRSDFSHVLMLDSDVAVDAQHIMRLTDSGHLLCGIPIPRRHLDFTRAEPLVREGLPVYDALRQAYTYTARGLGDHAGDFCRANAIGTGVMLIARQCFERIAGVPGLTQQYRDGGRELRGFFQRMLTPDRILVAEDYSFCDRHCRAGGEIWAYTKADVMHSGHYDHIGNFGRALSHKRTDQ